ncbi:DTW-domain-containing protein [Rozella allomycis CSF55]|uniref:tRNA-uridine aminocarboxypropyltransferase 1 n=1 Tax=Rozella allomycis (strain CSF55) TaxID=988480 RepID=A0A075AY77_ROZAC|nr:DTW domain-containing protein [Rozella allomycis CSF55]RKP20338.1 DTW-domain-containing protein [Rozella allomycis CSF55]|eukprot:EPZ33647.1 DTW domain-containing protein [Rozella allomycis CSF55]
MEEFLKSSPFYGFHISSHDELRNTEDRHRCNVCGQLGKYYCKNTKCGVSYVDIPKVRLPISLDIIKHSREKDSKSTAIHAKLASPSETNIYLFPEEDFSIDNPEETLLLFPSVDAKPISQLDCEKYKKLIVIDGTWKQAKMMVKSNKEKFSKVQKVCIQQKETLFWRHQRVSKYCLATIEAIYHFMIEFLAEKGQDSKSVDNLLFFFSFFYNRIQNHYTTNDIPFVRIPDYIKYETNE